MRVKPIYAAIILIAVFVLCSLFYIDNNTTLSERIVRISPHAYGSINGKRIMPTHIYLSKELNTEIISDFANSRFLFRKITKDNNSTWTTTPFTSLKRPHALTYDPNSKVFFAVDTDNHQIISFKSLLGDDSSILKYKTIDDFQVGNRPHDILYDRYVYVMLNKGVLRFFPDNDTFEDITFYSKSEMANILKNSYPDFSIGYIRSLTIVDGTIYLVNSTFGNIIEIKDFSKPESWKVHINKDQPNKYSEKGSFKNNQLILNDIEYYQGYWYASNYYVGTESNFRSSAEVSKNKLIRWKSWEDFKNSKWEDISHLIHSESVPYNFTRFDNKLYLSMFHSGNEEGLGSGVYQIKTSYF